MEFQSQALFTSAKFFIEYQKFFYINNIYKYEKKQQYTN